MISRDLARDPSPTRERDAVLTCGAACVHLQVYIAEQEGLPEGTKPVSFVFHGGSGSSREDIRYAIEAGTVKMNIDTDTQWAFWDGLRSYEAEFRPYLQGQIGNPDGDEKPNKKYYDPRMALRRGEEFMAKRLVKPRPYPSTLAP